MLRPPSDAEHDLGDVLDVFHDCTLGGVRDYHGPDSLYADTAATHRTNTTRSIIYDHITERLRIALRGVEGFRVEDRNQSVRFHHHEKWVILAHKADNDLAIALNRTRQSSLFQENDLQPLLDLYLDGEELFPEKTVLFLVYVPNKKDPCEPWICLVCPGDGGRAWHIDLSARRAASAPVVEIGAVPESSDDDTLVKIPSKGDEAAEDDR